MTNQTYLADWDRTNPMDTERRLKELLHGKRLVGELDLTPEENVFQMSSWVFNGVTNCGDYTRLSRYPAVTVVFLVGKGGRGYDEGTFFHDNLTRGKILSSLSQRSPVEFHRAAVECHPQHHACRMSDTCYRRSCSCCAKLA